MQKQPSIVVLRKKCSENMQQIYKRTFASKCEAASLKSHFGRPLEGFFWFWKRSRSTFSYFSCISYCFDREMLSTLKRVCDFYPSFTVWLLNWFRPFWHIMILIKLDSLLKKACESSVTNHFSVVLASHSPWNSSMNENILYSFIPSYHLLIQSEQYTTTRKRCKISSKLTIKTHEQRQWRCSGVFIANFEHILNPFLVFYCWLWTSKC